MSVVVCVGGLCVLGRRDVLGQNTLPFFLNLLFFVCIKDI